MTSSGVKVMRIFVSSHVVEFFRHWLRLHGVKMPLPLFSRNQKQDRWETPLGGFPGYLASTLGKQSNQDSVWRPAGSLSLCRSAVALYFKLLVGWRWGMGLQSKIWLRLISLGEKMQQPTVKLSDSWHVCPAAVIMASFSTWAQFISLLLLYDFVYLHTRIQVDTEQGIAQKCLCLKAWTALRGGEGFIHIPCSGVGWVQLGQGLGACAVHLRAGVFLLPVLVGKGPKRFSRLGSCSWHASGAGGELRGWKWTESSEVTLLGYSPCLLPVLVGWSMKVTVPQSPCSCQTPWACLILMGLFSLISPRSVLLELSTLFLFWCLGTFWCIFAL